MAYFHCLIGGGSSGGGYELTVTCDADFAGTTITCTDGVTTLTQTCPSASPYEVTFEIPNGGEWTISGIISGQTYSTAIDIPDSLELHSVPEGSTVLPTDDIQTWLACAGITDKSYTTLNEVLADSTTLLALISDNNSSDYLVRSTTWASGITADSTAMTDIGANNYCANTLLSDSTWADAICNSTYFESVLNTKVPTMTSNTTPSGVASTNSTLGATGYEAWRAFDNTIASGHEWISASVTSKYIQYEFTESVVVNKMKYFGCHDNSTDGYLREYEILASNDNFVNDSHTIIHSDTERTTYGYYEMAFANNNAYKYYRLNVISTLNPNTVSTSYYCRCCILQFYGRVDV